MLKNLENKGDPWGMGEARRADWIDRARLRGPGRRRQDRAPTWSTCSGSAAPAPWRTGPRRPPRPSPPCCTPPGSSSRCSARPRPAPATRPAGWATSSCTPCWPSRTSRPSTRPRPKTIVASCPHCFNTIANEYPQLGGNYEVIHHTQLLARLVEQGKLTPVTQRVEEKITYHDPCFLGRHNKVFTPPREIMEAGPRRAGRRRCTAARSAASAAARAAPGCGWKSASASGSTPSGSRRPWP